MTDDNDGEDDGVWDWRMIRGTDGPVWVGGRVGDKPPPHPDRDRIVQLCREALLGSFEERQEDGLEFYEREEPAVVVVVQDVFILFRLPTVLWPHPYEPVRSSVPLFEVPIAGMTADQLRGHIEKTRSARREQLRPCHFCKEPTPPEHAHEIDGRHVCHGCSERHCGVRH